jgi:hypothetical protein
MSEKDLELKLLARRLVWEQGGATRLNVPLRTAVDRERAGSRYQEFTDLDVLGTFPAPNSQHRIEIFDCKTSTSRTTERMFWLRGVSDLFAPDRAWLLRTSGVTEAARVLAQRLDLGTLTSADLDILLRVHTSGANSHAAIERLFDPAAHHEFQSKVTTLDKKLKPLAEALRYDAWATDSHRNLSALPATLARAKGLSSENPVHVALLLDLAWLYLFALTRAVSYVATTGANEIAPRFEEYFLGGQQAKREKEALAKTFADIAGGQRALLPGYFRTLVEVFGRYFIAPSRLHEGMRYLEVLAAGVAVKRRPNLAEAFGDDFDPVAAKLACDVLTFLVGTGDLPPSFRVLFRELLMGMPPETRTADAAPDAGTTGEAAADASESSD